MSENINELIELLRKMEAVNAEIFIAKSLSL